jgi:hypothetical protein
VVVLADRDRAAAAGDIIADEYCCATGRAAAVMRVRE